ncbi:hypothetical protein HS5_23630 [Acidianus sp. HS-5]|nr:hypothetical protein HS5_23630 [Acidianus sp. HS-5]
MRDARDVKDLAKFVVRMFSNLEVLMVIVDKLKLLQENPFKYAGKNLEETFTVIRCSQ